MSAAATRRIIAQIMNELQIQVMQHPGKIETNFVEIKAALLTQMQAYEELDVTEGNIPERKADVATLRKIRKAIDDRRKEVKKAYNVPLAEFEGKVKDLTSIIDGQIDRLNDGLNRFEEKRKADKRIHVAQVYAQNIGEYAEFLPLDKVQTSQWLNKTYSDADIISDIQYAIMKVKEDVSTIKLLRSEIEEELIDVYKRTGSINAAVMRSNDYNEAKRIACQKAAGAPGAPKAEEVSTRPVESAPEAAGDPTGIFKVFGAEAIDAVREFLELAGIEYEEIQ